MNSNTVTAGATAILAAITIWYAISTYRLLKETQLARKIKDIEYQLAEVYLPMEKTIEDYKRTINASTFNPDLVDTNRNTLETALREIKSRNLSVFDDQVMRFSIGFFSNPSSPNLDTFLHAVNNKTTALKNERTRLIQDGKEHDNVCSEQANNLRIGVNNRDKEIEKRERLVQIFLIIGSFFVAYSGPESIKQNIITPLFAFFLFFIILYYIIITRTRDTYLSDLYALISSIFYSLLIVIFAYSRSSTALSRGEYYLLTGLFTLIFTFSLLSPENSEGIVNFFEEIKKKYPWQMKIVVTLIAIIALGWFLWNYWGSIFVSSAI